MSDFVKQEGSINAFSGTDAWVILSPIEQSIKRKIEAVGIPLKDWDIQINYGIKTGCNEAFIISTEKRDEILTNCQSEDERRRTEELIRPILRGRDIKRYGYEWAGLWIINTHNGIKGKIERIHIENYPALKEHLDQYLTQISKRADKGDTPYNLRNCAYLEDFLKPKIVWKRVGSILRFGYNNNKTLGLDSTCFAIGTNIEYICCVLNSPLGHYLLKNAPQTGTGDLLISVQAVAPIKVPPISYEVNCLFKELLQDYLLQKSVAKEKEINQKVYSLYGLSLDEIKYIDENFT